jgi:hypothetical protein
MKASTGYGLDDHRVRVRVPMDTGRWKKFRKIL